MAASIKRDQKINVRQIKEEDIANVLSIDARISGTNRALTYTKVPYNYVGGELDISVVAEIEEKLVGFLFGRLTDSHCGPADTAVIQVMGVDPAYYRNGVGSALVQHFVQRCKTKGVKSVHSSVRLRDTWLSNFLDSQGFENSEMVELIRQI